MVAVSNVSKLMRVSCSVLLLASLAFATTATTKPKPKSASVSSKVKKSSHKSSAKGKKSRKTARKRGQQNIDSTRAREIQEALIRDGYLQGEASGTWDQASQKAMEKYQSDNGWQSKVIPDSRALIKLGLGPDHQHLLNPESAMTTAPDPGPSAAKDAAANRTPQK